MDEFVNVTLSLDNLQRHVFRVQAARCHEYYILSKRLAKKYEYDTQWEYSELRFQKSTSGVWARSVRKMEKDMKSCFTPEEKQALISAHVRTVEAKQMFERIDGDYQKYQ